MTQLIFNAVGLPPVLVDRISKIADAYKALSSATRGAQSELRRNRVDFPDSLPILLEMLDLNAEHLSQLLKPHHLTGYEDQARRDSYPHESTAAKAPAENGREASNK